MQYLIQEVGASQSPAGSRWKGALLNLDVVFDTWRTLWHGPSRLSSEQPIFQISVSRA